MQCGLWLGIHPVLYLPRMWCKFQVPLACKFCSSIMLLTHYLYVFHVLSCFFCSRFYLKLQENSSFLALLLFFVMSHPFSILTPADVAVRLCRISSAYLGTSWLAPATAAFWQCQRSLTSATRRFSGANSLKA